MKSVILLNKLRLQKQIIFKYINLKLGYIILLRHIQKIDKKFDVKYVVIDNYKFFGWMFRGGGSTWLGKSKTFE